ncbi:MAG: hypothetical protein KC636_00835, partial [Myxococcales bacterium]|nr:hypothetical protein [Myxococcales bacterium]
MERCAGRCALAAALALSPISVARAQVTIESPAAATRRQDLHNAGQARYDAGDYAGAFEQWAQVHAELPDDPALAAYRAVLLHAIGSAALEAHAQGDPAALEPAAAIFERDLDPARTAAQGGVEDPAQRSALLEKKRALDLAVAETAAPEPEPEPPPVITPPPPVDDGKAAARARSRTLLITGGALTGAGVALLSGMIVALVRGGQLEADGAELRTTTPLDDQQFDSIVKGGVAANNAAIATGVIGGVMLATGIPLLVIGARARRLSLSPGPGQAGLTLRLR